MKTKIKNLLVMSVLFVNPALASGSLINLGEGAVLDLATGLEWQARFHNLSLSWPQAQNYCENLLLANKSDWRLPSVREMATIRNPDKPEFVDEAVFEKSLHGYTERMWTSTNSVANIGASAHWLFVDSGGNKGFDVKNNSDTYAVRCVRREIEPLK